MSRWCVQCGADITDDPDHGHVTNEGQPSDGWWLMDNYYVVKVTYGVINNLEYIKPWSGASFKKLWKHHTFIRLEPDDARIR